MQTINQGGAPKAALPRTVATELVRLLWQLGVRQAFGVCGREIVALWAELVASRRTGHPIQTHHMRHENGAGYAAVASWVTSGRPAAVFVTAGPGVTNVITSLETARAAGAQLILLSPLTPAGHRGRLGIQDTSNQGYHDPGLYAPGRLFDLVALLESPGELEPVVGQLASGLARPGRGFLAHIAIPTNLQGAAVGDPTAVPRHELPAPGLSQALADRIVAALRPAPFAVWVGWGARRHAAGVRRLLDLTGAPAMSSPRGLGIADRHPQFIGVTGNGGHDTVREALEQSRAERVLVLGSGLGEATSGWRHELAPPAGFVHVDLDDRVFARAYPHVPTLGVQADIGDVLAVLLSRAGELGHRAPGRGRGVPPRLNVVPDDDRPVDPRALMAAIQRLVIDGTAMPVLADAASAMFWAAHHLVFPEPGRWFVENRFGAMGAAAAAVVGAAGRDGRALALVGDGALHMQDEINAAVRYGIGAIWVVLNDSGLGIVRTGMRLDGYGEHDADYPPTDFAAVARAKGAAGIRVERASDLDAALERALDAVGPFVVDVVIDPDVAAPIGARRAAEVPA